MAEVVGIEPSVLRDVARIYATSKASIIFWGMGISQHTHGTDNARCLIALALITGQIGRPGTGLHQLRGQNNVQGASDAGLIPWTSRLPAGGEARHPRQVRELLGRNARSEARPHRRRDHGRHPRGRDHGHVHHGREPGDVGPRQDHGAQRRWHKLDHLVVQDIFLTERRGMPTSCCRRPRRREARHRTRTRPPVQMGRPALAPAGRGATRLGAHRRARERIGLDWKYREVSEVYAEMAATIPSRYNISWNDTSNARSRRLSGQGTRCPATRSRSRTVSRRPTAAARSCPADLLPPDEVPDNEFPLVLTTGPATRALAHRLDDAPAGARRDRTQSASPR